MKKNITYLFLAGLAVPFLLASSVAAAGRPTLAQQTADIGAKNFCTTFSSLAQKYLTNVTNQINKLTSRIDTEGQDVTANRQKADTTLAQKRSTWEQNRQAIYTKLDNRATTTVQQQAVATFKTTIEAAITTRENAIDAAQTAFRQGFDQLITVHQTDAKQVLTAYQTALQAAINQADNSCSSGTTAATVRTSFHSALEAARQARVASTQGIDKIGPQVAALTQTRKDAIQQAVQNFQTVEQAAVAALRAAFMETMPPTSATTSSATATP